MPSYQVDLGIWKPHLMLRDHLHVIDAVDMTARMQWVFQQLMERLEFDIRDPLSSYRCDSLERAQAAANLAYTLKGEAFPLSLGININNLMPTTITRVPECPQCGEASLNNFKIATESQRYSHCLTCGIELLPEEDIPVVPTE